MSRGAMNKDVKYYCTGCQEKEQELTELKKLAWDLIEQWDYNKDVGLQDYIDKLKQAVTLANKDSKLDKKTVIDNLLKCDSPLD